jgi:peptide/nickel transport system ATP-binding protein
LLESRLAVDPRDRIETPPLTGDPPNPIAPPSGCRFRTRCAFAEEICADRSPTLGGWRDSTAHLASCHMMDRTSGHSRAGQALPLATQPKKAVEAQRA